MNEYVLVMLMHESHNIFELQLQEAFAAGLIKPGLNSVQEVTKKRPKSYPSYPAETAYTNWTGLCLMTTSQQELKVVFLSTICDVYNFN